MISILSYDDSLPSRPIDSPRSLKAIQQLGYDLQSLYKLNQEQIQAVAFENGYSQLNNQDFQAILDNIEKRRQYKVLKVKNLRQKLLKHEDDGQLKFQLQSNYSNFSEQRKFKIDEKLKGLEKNFKREAKTLIINQIKSIEQTPLSSQDFTTKKNKESKDIDQNLDYVKHKRTIIEQQKQRELSERQDKYKNKLLTYQIQQEDNQTKLQQQAEQNEKEYKNKIENLSQNFLTQKQTREQYLLQKYQEREKYIEKIKELKTSEVLQKCRKQNQNLTKAQNQKKQLDQKDFLRRANTFQYIIDKETKALKILDEKQEEFYQKMNFNQQKFIHTIEKIQQIKEEDGNLKEQQFNRYLESLEYASEKQKQYLEKKQKDNIKAQITNRIVVNQNLQAEQKRTEMKAKTIMDKIENKQQMIQSCINMSRVQQHTLKQTKYQLQKKYDEIRQGIKSSKSLKDIQSYAKAIELQI